MSDIANKMDWDAVINDDGKAGAPFIVLEEGDYDFTVTNFERATYKGSERIPECNKASLTLTVHTDKGDATAKTDLILYRTLEWKLSAFFRCIGQKQHGEQLKMDWNKVPGAKGRAHFKPREYTNSSGEKRTTNDVERYLDPATATKPESSFGGYGDF